MAQTERAEDARMHYVGEETQLGTTVIAIRATGRTTDWGTSEYIVLHMEIGTRNLQGKNRAQYCTHRAWIGERGAIVFYAGDYFPFLVDGPDGPHKFSQAVKSYQERS